MSTDAPKTLGERIPFPDEESYPNITHDEALELFMQWCEDTNLELWPHQEEAIFDLAASDHVILATPTGSGKSMVALAHMFMAVCTNRRAFYTAPIKALVSEKFFDMVGYFGAKNVGMMTGDASINPNAPIICCTAEILAQIALQEGAEADVGAVAMDEFHFFGDSDRGWAWQVPLLELPHAQFLLMSATLGDTSQIQSLLERETDTTVDLVDDAVRPVPLSYEFVQTSLEATVELALREGDAPIYIVHFSQADALKSATALASFGVSTKEQRNKIKELTRGTRFNTPFGKQLQRLLTQGVGIHHAGMLPRYRLLVENLAQQGLLPVICGTDTLGVGINVPIHTVLLCALAKFDGHKQRRLNVREFHQICGRAGRAGFDTEGRVIALATEQDIEYNRQLLKAAGDPKRARKIKKPKAPEGFVGWNEQTFQRLIDSQPETLIPKFKMSHAIVLAVLRREGHAFAHLMDLIDASLQSDEQKAKLKTRAMEIISTLLDAGVISQTCDDESESSEDADIQTRWLTATWHINIDLPIDFALDQPLAPFMLAALELLDPESESYTFDLISLVEATLEDPPSILRAQQKEERSRRFAELKAEGVDYETLQEELAEVTYPMPLKDLIDQAFSEYVAKVPWAQDFSPSPKSILRQMLEQAADFTTYIGTLKMARAEGTLLRYLSDAYRVLDRTVPEQCKHEQLNDIISWLKLIVFSTDSSLVEAWANFDSDDSALNSAPELDADVVVKDVRAVELLVRNSLFARVRLMAHRRIKELAELDSDWGYKEGAWRQRIDAFFEEHDEILLDADARSTAYYELDKSGEKSHHSWDVHQIIHDSDLDHDWGIWATVDLDATQEAGTCIFSRYFVGTIEDALANS